jgi:hypothetical protein
MITIEAVTTAIFGAVLGTGPGLSLGVALQRGLVSSGAFPRHRGPGEWARKR